ncbi:MAG: family 78 glycoside hydrolase catalytic domain [Planctomycetaceae bacterium]|nr:family 78 glycoside hydrolase catalytic domain [Planctomycetaceae bacterium]
MLSFGCSVRSSFILLSHLSLIGTVELFAADVRLVEQSPVLISSPTPEVFLADFGKVAFGNLQLVPGLDAAGKITVHFGEKLKDGRIDRNPPGSVRYQAVTVNLNGDQSLIVAPPADARNTEQVSNRHPPAVLTPCEWGVVLPFRWIEIEGWSGELNADQIVRRAAFPSSWEDDAASFESSDPMLNRIWELCRYTIKAATFAGVYVDGDRERISYEADSYVTQLSHYYTGNDIQMARDTHDRLMQYETWPTECAPHMIFMVHADWLHTGDTEWLASRYEALKGKALLDRVRADGLVASDRGQLRQLKKSDLVDWLPGERDGYVFTEVNTVVNAFHLAAIAKMAELALALGKTEDARDFQSRFSRTHAEFQRQLFDAETGIYHDGIGTRHTSQHATIFPLAFGLIPADKRQQAAGWLHTQGMQCSVFVAQYLLEGLFQNGAGKEAIELMTAPTDRSWRHMIDSGATMTWEAWDQKYKPNQDWNHSWGTAPANLLPRFVLGVQTREPGWQRVLIRPCPAGLASAKGKIPTPRGPIFVDWNRKSAFQISIMLPDGVTAKVELPAEASVGEVYVNGNKANARRLESSWIVDDEVSGTVTVEVRRQP